MGYECISDDLEPFVTNLGRKYYPSNHHGTGALATVPGCEDSELLDTRLVYRQYFGNFAKLCVRDLENPADPTQG